MTAPPSDGSNPGDDNGAGDDTGDGDGAGDGDGPGNGGGGAGGGDGDGDGQTGNDGGGAFDADSANPDRNKVIAGTICDRLATIQCEGEEFCCDAPGRDFASCKQTMLQGCRDELMADQVAEQPIAGFDPVAAEAAFTELERLASTCDPGIASFGESQAGLRGIFKGTVSEGGRCQPLNVTSRSAVAASLAGCVNGGSVACLPGGLTSWTCEPRAGVGGKCFSDLNCTDGLFCDNPDFDIRGSTCMARKAPGSPCETPNECSSLACRGGSCAEAGVQAAYCLQ